MSVYRNGKVIKFGITQFCNFFNCDIEIEYFKDKENNEYLYKISERQAWGQVFRICELKDAVLYLHDAFDKYVIVPLLNRGFKKAYNPNSFEKNFYEQAKDWIESSVPDLLNSDIYGVICVLCNSNVLRNDLQGSPRFIRRARMAYAKVCDNCYTIEQALYLANKLWDETKDKNYWDYFYIEYGNAVIKDFKAIS